MTLVSDATAIARAGVRAADPARAVRRELRCHERWVQIGRARLVRPTGGRLHLVAIGKAAGAMVDAAVRVVGRDAEGISVTPSGYPPPRARIPVLRGEHPIPRSGSFRAGDRLLAYVRSTRPEDVLVYLISGGGSAVAEVPATPLRRSDLTATTRELLRSGAPIGGLNALRRHLSAIKGGQLALAAPARRFGTLVLSDVVGDPPPDIASGPTVGDPSTFGTALEVVRSWRLGRRLPPRVVQRLRAGARGAWPETPKPSEPRLRRAPFVVAASNRHAVAAAAEEARCRGYRPRVVAGPIVGETRAAGIRFARALLAVRSGDRTALVGGGETTVTLGPRPGRGGRNQEFALAAASPLEGRNALVLSIGTDGIDGPTDAAGGWTDGRTMLRARARRVDLEVALHRHASYAALERLGALLRTGPTGTNVTDLHVGLAGRGR